MEMLIGFFLTGAYITFSSSDPRGRRSFCRTDDRREVEIGKKNLKFGAEFNEKLINW